jgi:hypothetical protein
VFGRCDQGVGPVLQAGGFIGTADEVDALGHGSVSRR